ncbi:MAG: hypothetical protein FWH21_05085, partial [Kiritimatiellaeota bacterium]|nr:hypothetical protein [Kiritimatiellota bacterium]
MPFPVTVLLDRDAPSETFIRREIDLLRQRGWELHVRYLTQGPHPLRPLGLLRPLQHHLRFMRVALRRTLAMLPRSPLCALRMLKRLPQAAALARDIADTRSRLVWAQFAGITADIAGIAAETAGAPWVCSAHARGVFTPPPRVLACR